jgi:uncharacterized protein (DUF1015 family)
MADLRPFRALRPAPEAAARVASVPYDVVTTEEARALGDAEPLSFLHVTRAEIDLPADTPPYDDGVYARAVRNLRALTERAPLVREAEPALYVYRLTPGLKPRGPSQTGIAGLFSLDEYDGGSIKKHEKTRKDKEDDRTRHIVETGAQTGIVFLTHRASADVSGIVARVTAAAPLYDVAAPDGVRHEIWRVTGPETGALVEAFRAMPALYIADGHHRVASAARAREELRASGRAAGSRDRFVAVSFPDDEVRILAYNRVVKDLAAHTPQSLVEALRARGLGVTDGPDTPARKGQVSMLLGDRWYTIELPAPPAGTSRSDALDAEVLHREVLGPVLGIGDIRSDKRVDFVGGIKGAAGLADLVRAGKAAVAFSLHPVTMDDLMAIADASGIMPPKSTWFEPKLRDGLLVHVLE